MPLPIKLRGDFFDCCHCCCRRSLGCSFRCKGRMPASGFFECFPRCPGFHSPLILMPLTWRNRLRLLTGEHPSPLYITALQTLQRVVLKARDRDGSCSTCVTYISVAHTKHRIATAPFKRAVRRTDASCVSFEDVGARAVLRQAAPPSSHV